MPTLTDRTYFLICGNSDCINRTRPRPNYARAGWHVRESDLVDGELWTCPDCRGVDWPKTTAPNWREEWVSWFVNGRAEHFLCDSPTGRAITAQLAKLDEESRRRCAWPGCDEPARAKSQTCSDTHKKAVARAAKKRREERDRDREIALKRVDLPENAPTGTNDALLPGAMPSVIADIADIADNPGRRCANCGADISDRRADARFCKRDACRKAVTRRAAAIAAAADLQLVLDLTTDAKTEPRSR